jgi:hypothetical protein
MMKPEPPSDQAREKLRPISRKFNMLTSKWLLGSASIKSLARWNLGTKGRAKEPASQHCRDDLRHGYYSQNRGSVQK